MKVKVVYVWDSETNTYSPDIEDVDVIVEPTTDDRMRWRWHRAKRTGTMNLTRGFEMLMYLAGFANDAISQSEKLCLPG